MKKQLISYQEIMPGDRVMREERNEHDGWNTVIRIIIHRVERVDTENDSVYFTRKNGTSDSFNARGPMFTWFLLKRPQPKLGSRWVDPVDDLLYVAAYSSMYGRRRFWLIDQAGSGGSFVVDLDSPIGQRLIKRSVWKAQQAKKSDA